MKRSYFKSRLFWKYFGSYLFILLIPLIFMTVVIYESAVKNLRAQIERSHLDQLTQTKEMVDGRMKELHDIASRISYDHRLTPYWVHHPYYSSEAIRALDQYKAASSIIDEIFLYFHQDDKIYSSSGMYSFDVFADLFRYENRKKEAIYRDLNHIQQPTIYPSDQINRKYAKHSMLTYLVPITPGSTHPHGTIMYLIKESAVTGLINSILGNYQGLTLIFDNNRNILTSNFQGEAIDESDLRLLYELPPGIHSRVIADTRHSVVSVKSENNGWTYMTIMPSAQFFSTVFHIQSLVAVLFAVAVAVGAAISVLMARMQYEPVSTLTALATHTIRGRGKEEAGDSGSEWDRIRAALQEYSSRVDLQEPYARNHLLSLLLKYGIIRHLPGELLAAFDLRFDHPRHFVMVIGWGEHRPSHAHMPERHEMMQMMARIEFPELAASAYGVELTQIDQVAFIIGFHPDPSQDEGVRMRNIVEAVRANLLEFVDAAPRIGVGTCYPSPDQWNQSYIEAYTAFEMSVPGNPAAVTYFDQLPRPAEHVYWIPNQLLMKLSQSLKQGSYEVAAEMIRSAVRFLHAPDYSPMLKRCISFDILNTLLKTAAELGSQHSLHDQAPGVVFSPSLDELERNLLKLASDICDQVVAKQRQQEQSLMDRIVDYVDRHFTDHMLSLETVAFAFSVSPSHVSRSFKEKTGVNFSQYVWQKRLDEVKRRLIATDDPLKDIIAQVGYLDAPNFIRKFKKAIGCTPGQYRKMHT